MLVPERGDPTTKIGLFVLRCILVLGIIHLFASSQASHSVRIVSQLVFLCSIGQQHAQNGELPLKEKFFDVGQRIAVTRLIIRIYRALFRIYDLLNGPDQDWPWRRVLVGG